MTPADRRILLYYCKTGLKVLWYLCLIPVAIFGMFVIIPFLVLRMIFYAGDIASMTVAPGGRKRLAAVLADDNYSQGGGDAYLEDGFNVDLDRDFVGAAQVRYQERAAGRVLQARK